MRHYGIFLGLVAVMLLAAACTTTDEPTSTPPAVVPTATPTPTATAPAPTATATEQAMSEDDLGMMAPSGDLVLSLHDLNDSGQTGIAVLTANGSQTDVTLIATTGISELNHIHSGSCMDLGGVTYPLTSMANGTSVTTVDVSLDTLTAGDLAINLHKAGDPGTYTACIEIPTKDQYVTVSLAELDSSGQSGVASLIAKGNQTEVVLYATAAISELNHIHTGSCMDLGGVTYPLTSMANGTSVTTVDVSLDTLTAGDLAINLHKAGDPGTYTSCSDIPVKDMTAAAQTLEVIIASFILPDLNVTLGTTVTWTNQDGAPHTTTSGQNALFDGDGWNSSTLSMGQTFSHTFDQVGTFAYTCRIHPSMNGTVTVTDSTVSSSSGTQASGSGESEY